MDTSDTLLNSQRPPGLWRRPFMALFSPGRLYEQLGGVPSYASSLVFLISCACTAAFLGGVMGQGDSARRGLALLINEAGMMVLTSVLLYCTVTLLCRGTFTYKGIFGITSYSGATLLLAWIPGMAPFAGLWRLSLIGVGLARLGPMSGRKAFLCVAVMVTMFLALLRLAVALLAWGHQ